MTNIRYATTKKLKMTGDTPEVRSDIRRRKRKRRKGSKRRKKRRERREEREER